MNTGAPMIDSTMPTDNSKGANAHLAKVSQITIKMPPHTTDKGNRYLVSLPTIRRTAWGTINPRKPIRPAKLTAAPAMQAAHSKNRKRFFFTGNPRLCATSSPRERISRAFALKQTRRQVASMSTMAGYNTLVYTEDRPPVRKAVTFVTRSGKRYTRLLLLRWTDCLRWHRPEG